jgi:hypothetical protein
MENSAIELELVQRVVEASERRNAETAFELSYLASGFGGAETIAI